MSLILTSLVQPHEVESNSDSAPNTTRLHDWPEQEEQDEEGWEALRGDVGLGVEDDEDDDADDGGHLHKIRLLTVKHEF